MLASWNALYWDDWVTYAGGRQGTIDVFAECTRCVIPFRGEIEGLLIAPGPWLMRLLVFVFYPMIAFLTQQFLRRTQWLRRDEETIIALGVLFLPMFGARVALINFHYAISLLLFVLGAWMMLSQRRLTRLASLVPLFWSMFTASLQIFAVVLLVTLCIRLVTRQDVLSAERLILIASFLVFPPTHQFVIPELFPQFAVTDGYNTVRTAFLLRGFLFGGFLLVPLIFVLFRWRRRNNTRRPLILLSIGLGLLAVGTFPYLAVGHFPNFSDWVLPLLPDQSDWHSRHQLLQPFGAAFLVLAIRGLMPGFEHIVLIALLVSCCSLNAATYSQYYIDSLKQTEILQFITDNADNFKEGRSLALTDRATDLNARGRSYRNSEFMAMIRSRTQTQMNVGADTRDFCESSQPDLNLIITSTRGRLRTLLSRNPDLSISLEPLPFCSN